MLKSITRHVHIFAAEVTSEGELIPNADQLTLDVDPDNELNWNETALQETYQKFEELVATYKGRDLTDYNLRRIGSDLEHFIRSLLRDGKIAYNLNSPVLNYSMGFPQIPADQVPDRYIPGVSPKSLAEG